jgi:hypothetical protein
MRARSESRRDAREDLGVHEYRNGTFATFMATLLLNAHVPGIIRGFLPETTITVNQPMIELFLKVCQVSIQLYAIATTATSGPWW